MPAALIPYRRKIVKKFGFASLFLALTLAQVGCTEPASTGSEAPSTPKADLPPMGAPENPTTDGTTPAAEGAAPAAESAAPAAEGEDPFSEGAAPDAKDDTPAP